MGKQSKLNRRDFLKNTAIGTAGLAAGISLLKAEKASAAAIPWPTGGWPAPPGTMAINPNISNLRVVCMYNPNIITNPALNSWSVDNFANAVSAAAISTDMDNMAMWLAQKTTAAEAWSTIFQKPAAKTWAQVNVAIKVNSVNPSNQPRIPVIGKICNVLFSLGVPAAQIAIYDRYSNSSTLNPIGNYFSSTITLTITKLTTAVAAGAVYTNNGHYFTVATAAASGATSLTVTNGGALSGAAGTLTLSTGTGQASIAFSANTGTYNGYPKYPGVTNVGNIGLGNSNTTVTVPLVPLVVPADGSADGASCPTYLANGTIDILVNIGVNKGHSITAGGNGNMGGCTLSLKNHFGTLPAFHITNVLHTTFTFTVPALTTAVAMGAIYTCNGKNYTVLTAAGVGATSLQLTGGTTGAFLPADPTGTLNLSTGTGQTSITFTAVTFYDQNNANMAFTTGDIAALYSMSSAIVGGTPVRQQLCIIDSLWSDNTNYPLDPPSYIPARLVMGTFTGAVDYLTCMNIKNSNASQTIGGHTYSCGGPDANLDLNQVANFLTLFGYATTDPTLQWVPITPASVYTTQVLPEAASGQQSHSLVVRLAGSSAMARFALPRETARTLEIRMFDISGRNVRKMSVQLQGSHTSVLWDGKNDGGGAVAPGTYVVRVTAQNYMQSARITVE